MNKNAYLYLSIGIRASHSKLLSEIHVYSNNLCMSLMKESGSTNFPPLLDGTNCIYWKV